MERKLELDGAIEVGKNILHGRIDTWKILVNMHNCTFIREEEVKTLWDLTLSRLKKGSLYKINSSKSC